MPGSTFRVIFIYFFSTLFLLFSMPLYSADKKEEKHMTKIEFEKNDEDAVPKKIAKEQKKKERQKERRKERKKERKKQKKGRRKGACKI